MDVRQRPPAVVDRPEAPEIAGGRSLHRVYGRGDPVTGRAAIGSRARRTARHTAQRFIAGG
ncbi:hypothetical protein A7982_12728 [Minicystis rosea]|nr:hypothetical protein A7982_12728 [Minicystis rosea]